MGRGQKEEPWIRMSAVVLFLYNSNSNPLGRRVIVKSRKLILNPLTSTVKSIDEGLLDGIERPSPPYKCRIRHPRICAKGTRGPKGDVWTETVPLQTRTWKLRLWPAVSLWGHLWRRWDYTAYLVSNVQYILQIGTHSMMFHSQKYGIQYDANSNEQLE